MEEDANREKRKDEDEDETLSHPLTHLFAEIDSEDASLEDTAQSFVERTIRFFDRQNDGVNPIDRDPTLELLTATLLASSGVVPSRTVSRVVELVTERMIDNDEENDQADRIEGLVHSFCENIVVPKRYPIIKRKDFRQNFCEFWSRLIAAAENDLLFRPRFLTTLIPWLSTCSGGALRSLRHTASLAAMTVVSALLRAHAKWIEKRTIAKRRVDTERKKSGTRRTQRLTALEDEYERLKNNATHLERHIMTVFHGVFVHRVDDVSDDIRADAARCFGVWALRGPQLVLSKNASLLAKQTTDFSPAVRLRAVESITMLCSNLSDDQLGPLRKFVGRRREALLGLARDVDDRVLTAGIGMIAAMRKRGLVKDGISIKEREQFESLLFEGNATVQRRAAKHLCAYAPELAPTQATQKQLAALLDVAERYERGEGEMNEDEQSIAHVDTLVRAFGFEMPALSDCEAMIDVLMKDGSAALSERRVVVLVRMMCASYSNLKNRACPVKSRLKGARLEKAANVVENFGATVVRRLPALMSRYLADVDVLRQLVKLPRLVDVRIVDGAQQKRNFTELLDALTRAFSTTSDAQVLNDVAAALQHFAFGRVDHAQRGDARTAVGTVVTDLAAQFERLSAEIRSKDDDTPTRSRRSRRRSRDASSTTSVTVCARRLHYLARWMDVRTWASKDMLRRLMDAFDTASDDPVSSSESLGELSGLLVLWTMWTAESICERVFRLDGGSAATASTDNGGESNDDLPEALRNEMVRLGEDVNRIGRRLIEILRALAKDNGSFRRATTRAAFVALGDLRLIFSRSQIRRKFSRCAEASVLALKLTDEDVLVMAKASSDLLESDDAATASEECDILQTMTLMSGPGVGVAELVESAYLLSLVGRCRTASGEDVLKKWCREMGKRAPRAYLEIQLATLKRTFAECQRGRGDSTVDQETCVNRYMELLTWTKRMSRFFGVGCVPRKLVPAYVNLLRRGIAYALERVPERFSFLDVLDYYVRVLSNADKTSVRRTFEEAVASARIADVRANDENADTANEGLWQAFDSFRATLAGDRVRTTGVAEKEDEVKPSPNSPTLDADMWDDDAASDRPRRTSARSGLRLDDLSDDDEA